MSYGLNNVTTADQYTNSQTLSDLPTGSKVNFQVSQAAIFYTLQYRRGGSIQWDQELYLLPSFASLSRPGVSGVKIRSAVAGVPAIVSVEVT